MLFNLKCIGCVRLKCEHMNFYLVKSSISKFKYKEFDFFYSSLNFHFNLFLIAWIKYEHMIFYINFGIHFILCVEILMLNVYHKNNKKIYLTQKSLATLDLSVNT